MKKSLKKGKKVNNSKVNLWVWDSENNLKRVSIDVKDKLTYIRNFGTEKLITEEEFRNIFI